MKKLFLVFIQVLLIFSLLIGCNTNKDTNSENSVPSKPESSTERDTKNEIPSIPELPYEGNPIVLPEVTFDD